MGKIKKGDIVGRISYGQDILFLVKRVVNLKNGKKIAILKGITERIEADSYTEDLNLISEKDVRKELERFDIRVEKRIINEQKKSSNYTLEKRQKHIVQNGKILHLDGDRRYSEKSSRYYRRLGLNAVVKNISESKQPKVVYSLLAYYKPDILVITGHDGMIKKETAYNDIYNYRNSRYFIDSVREARRYERDYKHEIAIFAGACQSYFEAIMGAGANFASSPARILIDILDPLIVAERIATTSKLNYLTIDDIENDLRDGKRGVGGTGVRRKKELVISL